MKYLKISFVSVVLSLLVFSCNDETLNPNLQETEDKSNTVNIGAATQPEQFKVSATEAENSAINFLNEFYGGFSKNGRMIQMEQVVPVRKSTSTLKKSLEVNATEDDEIGFDTLFYAVNLSDGQGYVLVAADKRTDPIYAFVDNGSFYVDSLDQEEYAGIATFLDYAVETELEDIANYGDTVVSVSKKSLSKAWSISVKKSPLLDTRWGQGDPYNHYCNGNKTGCVATAIAQILSYYKTPGSVSWNGNSTSLNWSRIMSDCKSNSGRLDMYSTPTSALEVAGLMRMLGVAFDADYGSSSTSIDSKKALKKLGKMGVLNVGSLNDFDITKIQSALQNNRLVFARGYRTKRKLFGYKNGHAWVYDGYINATQDGKFSFMVHCNWGWNGTANGYYIAKSFNVKNGPEITDTKDVARTTSSSDYNYKYKCQYSIIYK